MAMGGVVLGRGLMDAPDRVTAFMQQGLAEGAYPGCALVASRMARIRIERCLGTCMTLTSPQTPVTAKTLHSLYFYSK